MRPSDYARTPPEARKAFLVVVVHLVSVVMGRTYAAEFPLRQQAPAQKINANAVEWRAVVAP